MKIFHLIQMYLLHIHRRMVFLILMMGYILVRKNYYNPWQG